LGFWRKKLQKRELLVWIAGLSFCAAFFCGATVSVFQHFDYFILSSVLSGSGPIALLKFIIEQPPAWERPIGEFLSYLNAFVLLVVSRSLLAEKSNRVAFEVGVAIGAALSLVYLFGQIIELHFYFGLTRSVFFRYAGRYSGSFSDPNSFGLMAYLAVVYLASRTGQRYWRVFAGVAGLMAVGVLWSGSRTYWLGILASLICGLWLLLPEKRKRAIGLGVLGLLLCLVLLGWPRLNNSIAGRLPLPSTVRLLDSINWDNAGSALDSRLLFGRLALGAWSSAPVVGIGIDRFIWTQDQVAEQLGVDLKDFRDNANNYYLQVLTESGLTGLLLIIVGIFSFGSMLGLPQRNALKSVFKRRTTFSQIEEVGPRVLLWTIPLILLTGPHLAFAEVKYFLALLLAAFLTPRKIKHARPLIGFAVFSCLLSLGLILSSGSTRDHSGLYGVEDGGVRWTAQRAVFEICPEADDNLRVRALRPGIGYAPLMLKVAFRRPDTGEMLHSLLILKNNEWHQMGIPEALVYSSDVRLVTELALDSVWSPFKDEWSSDLRGLGVQIDWNSIACEKEPEIVIAPWAKKLLSVSQISAKAEIEG
jgi:hypothetical protein